MIYLRCNNGNSLNCSRMMMVGFFDRSANIQRVFFKSVFSIMVGFFERYFLIVVDFFDRGANIQRLFFKSVFSIIVGFSKVYFFYSGGFL